ncbi:11513_t:CDS:2, partial [Diversispora eburnea]
MFVDSLVEGKFPVKALIDTTSKYNTISRRLFDKLEEDYGIRHICDPVEILYGDVIAKISFEFSPEARSYHAKIVIDGMSIPLIEEGSRSISDSKSHKTSSFKNNLSKSTESKPGLAQEEMAPKKTNKDPDSQLSEKPTKSRSALAQLAKDDITAILYTKELKGGSKKVSEWYKIGTPKCNKIWKSENPYSYVNSIEDANLPNWYPNNTKIEKARISPELTPQRELAKGQEIITPKEPVIIKPDPIK